ncbi:MAG: tetratricopeptide repeat protein [Aureispira sp.]|nr:tetratricopeptide repeat protein [Aureispira sp.]
MLKYIKDLIILSTILIVPFACQEANTGEQPNVSSNIEMTGIPTVDKISKEIAEKPESPELYALRSDAYSKEDLYGEAVKDAERALKLDTTQLKYYRLLANAYFDNEQSRPATKTLERALNIFPKDIETILSLSEMYLIIQQYDKAIIHLDNLFKSSPQNADGLFLKGMVMKEMGDTIQAVENFQAAVEADADMLNAHVQLGTLFTALGRSIALRYYDNALIIDSTNYDALWKKADYFHEQKNYDEAMVWYDKLIYHYPQNAEVQYNAGLMQMEKEDYEKAFWLFDNATKFEPTFGEAYYFKGEAAENLNKKEEAIRYYQEAVNLNERWGWAKEALKRLNVEVE